MQTILSVSRILSGTLSPIFHIVSYILSLIFSSIFHSFSRYLSLYLFLSFSPCLSPFALLSLGLSSFRQKKRHKYYIQKYIKKFCTETVCALDTWKVFCSILSVTLINEKRHFKVKRHSNLSNNFFFIKASLCFFIYSLLE